MALPISSTQREGDPVERVKELTNGGVQHSFEVLGSKLTAEQAFGMLGPGGTTTIVGMIPFGTKIELHGADFLRERRIQGSVMGSNHFRVDMPRLVDFYLNGKLHLDDWITAKLKLSEINVGFASLKAARRFGASSSSIDLMEITAGAERHVQPTRLAEDRFRALTAHSQERP